MDRKTPSSLDYETLLHEIALKNWRRALLAGDFPRAFQNAERLARSRDRFWRWQGLLDVATTHLAAGESNEALEALASAKGVFADVGELQGPAIEMEAHVLAETGRAVEAVALVGPPTPLFRHHQAIALARLSRFEEAFERASPVTRDPLHSIVVLAEVLLARGRPLDAIDTLRPALSRSSRLAPGPCIPALDALARALLDAVEPEAALEALEDIDEIADGLLYWPLLWVRSHYRRGEVRHQLGDRPGAREALETFLRFWGRGDVDRERVDRAAQLVMA